MCIVDRLTFMFEDENKIMAEVLNLKRDEDASEWRRMIMPEELVLQQFTGLHDKNGKEIYEGDIVKTDGHFGIKIVEWLEQGGMFIVRDNAGWGSFTIQNLERIEVIGNIYETPELLKTN